MTLRAIIVLFGTEIITLRANIELCFTVKYRNIIDQNMRNIVLLHKMST